MSFRQYPEELPDWDNLGVIHRNTLSPRSNFFLFATEVDALTQDPSKALCQSLSGTWKFHFSPSPFQGPRNFWQPDFNAEAWNPITVPGHWQIQGLGGRPHYTNLPYPFPVNPPHVPYHDNETGRYLTSFRVKGNLKDDSHQLRLRFEGVDSAFKVWVNGHEVGYSQGARNPSEFDVTPFVRLNAAENILAVEVYARCDGTYIEDQDQWWLSGIFRDVYLHTFPRVHPEDVSIRTEPDGCFEDGKWKVHVGLQLNSETTLGVKLLNNAGAIVAQTGELSANKIEELELPVSRPLLWTAETPHLYTLVVSSDNFSFALRIGFRKVEIKEGVFQVNGKPVKFRGVNRHEHHPDSGRTVPLEFLKEDLHMMKQAGINAIRTSHYPNDPRLYDLADELGLWIIDEADLECHGFDRIGADEPADFTTDNPEWKEAYLDRASQLVYRDRNHPSVVIWSLGNEAWYGQNIRHMCELVKKIDPTRPVHYEQDREAETSDMLSIMYPSLPEVLEKASQKDFAKPYLLCEFAYAGGNGVACVDRYFDIFYQYPRCMGGFLWQWANNGLRTKTADGVDFFGYGGDFGDAPNDRAIMINGMCTSSHEPAPNFTVYQKAIQPVRLIRIEGDKIILQSRYDFISLDHLRCHWSLTSEATPDREQHELEIPQGIEPHTEFELVLPELLGPFTIETYLNLQFTTREDTPWAASGHQIAWEQARLSEPTNSVIPQSSAGAVGAPSRAMVEKTSGARLRIISSSGLTIWTIDLVLGALVSWVRDGLEIMARPLILDLWRATTEPDRRSHGVHWLERRVDQTQYTTSKVEWSDTEDDLVIVRVHGRVGPPVQAWGIELVTTFRIQGDRINIAVKGHSHGPNLPDTLPRIGLSTALHGVAHAQWYGRGPGESYVDKKNHQAFGLWKSSIDGLWVEYEEPQESGNRTDVRWVEFSGGSSDRRLRASFGALDGCSFAASHYDVADVAAAGHPFELASKRKEETVIRLDWQHQGVGSGLIESGTVEEEYQLKPADFEFSIDLD